jgi:hypothetical protein
MSIQDDFWQTSGRKKWRILREGLDRAARSTADVLHVSFASATGLPTKSPLDIAHRVNPMLQEHLMKSAPGFLGVIVMDFPSAFLCELIIRRNSAAPDPCRAVPEPLRATAAADWVRALCEELSSAAERADAAFSGFERRDHAAAYSWPQPGLPEDYQAKVRWLGHVYTELLVARAEAETGCPALDLPTKGECQSRGPEAKALSVCFERPCCVDDSASLPESTVSRLILPCDLMVMDDWVKVT